MPYLIETFDKPAHLPLRLATRDAHLRFLDEHKARLLACGAKLADHNDDADGGVYILDTEDRAEAEAFIAADPFSRAGLFERVEIRRWRKAYFNGQSCL